MGNLLNPTNPKIALNNLTLVSMIDLVLATIGLMLGVFVISEGKGGQPYRHEGKAYPGNAFFYFAWGMVFIVCLAQGLMAINLFSGASKFELRPLKSFKKITLWLIWSICLLFLLILGGIPVFALTNQSDEFYGFTIVYLFIGQIIFRLAAIILVEFNRDLIKRENFFPRVLPPSTSLILNSGGKLTSDPVYVNTDLRFGNLVSDKKKAPAAVDV